MERLPAVALAVTATTVLTACGESRPTPPPPSDLTTEIQRQYETLPYIHAEASRSDGVTLTFKPEQLSQIAGSVHQKVASAIVHLSANSERGPLIGSGFFFRGSNGQTKIVTAGHNLQPITNMSWTDMAGNHARTEGGEWHYNRVLPREDMGTVSLTDPSKQHALTARNLTAHPLKLGEQVYLVNFQQRNDIADQGGPAAYSMLYLGNNSPSLKEPFAAVLGDIQPGKEEDNVESGASGGVVVDVQGDVVGISVSSNKGTLNPPERCGIPIPLGELTTLGGENLYTRIVVPASADECGTGLATASIRLIEEADFLPVPGVEHGQVK